MFCTIAKAAPGAEWSADIRCISESGGDGCESYAKASYKGGKLELKTENFVDSVTMAALVSRMDSGDDSYEAFCEFYTVDDSIDEDTYEEYKFDECEDDFYFNHQKNTVSKRHLWDSKTIVIGE